MGLPATALKTHQPQEQKNTVEVLGTQVETHSINYAEYLSSLGVLHLGFPFKGPARPLPYLIYAEKLDENENEAIIWLLNSYGIKLCFVI